MSNNGELRAERAYVDALYEKLETERSGAAAMLARSAKGADTLLERDAAIDFWSKSLSRLNIADNGLCFGRLDHESGERVYVGRVGLFDDDGDGEALLIDWRAPVARPFYCATAVNPLGMARRRRFRTLGRRLVDFTDDLAAAHGENAGDAALLAAVNAPRGAGMRDIVATIQAEQDEIIRLDHDGVVVIEGGPGTGKTVVALHRVAYLLYTRRERLARRGVLVVGPHPGFLDHIARVLPSLGETDVVFATVGDLVPGLCAEAEEDPEVQRAKGALAMLDVLAKAVADRQELPPDPIPVALSDVPVELDAELAGAARERARATGLPHNEACEVFRREVAHGLAERAVDQIGEGWLEAGDTQMRAELLADVLEELGEGSELDAEIDRLWPRLTPGQLLADLFGSVARLASAGGDPVLFRADGDAWTVSDVPLLDEAVELLGVDRSAERLAELRRQAVAEYAAGVMDVLNTDAMDDDDETLRAIDLIDAGELSERHVERDHRELAERAAGDREWTYGHVVVDEAQELSEMDWRVLMRRCPSRSFTIVGDLAQRRSAAGATAWGPMLSPYTGDRWASRALTVNYRTPAEIMTVAGAVLGEFAPDVRPPESVRACGVLPWARRVSGRNLAGAFVDFDRDEGGREGTFAVIGPEGMAGVLTPAATKGLEFDAVLIVEPDRILAKGPRGASELYVALTRATQRLGVLHAAPLPSVLAGLKAGRRVPDSFLRCV
ncbi:RNA polymerase recycling motor ATPase HelR [Amycolatopsis sp. H20-H5]|uniref:RNA polymerase recycling motor ATPase HelR n=1 Tax=Amycolatopsis sp. H20-H5 TaxID=3046309 RepID=UPI002DBB6664|nr:RNA polymerase recycling motor ATPase HelR [Amycolatopsis sp. H20-H5]MEC3980147.1 RNA polymerase recycling motor ATPase HelR [Amycolatopsis sp. H20-H5]